MTYNDLCRFTAVLAVFVAVGIKAAANVVVVKNDDDLLPLDGLDVRSVGVINIGAEADNTFSEYCGRYTFVKSVSVKSGADDAAVANACNSLKHCDVVVAGVYSAEPWAVNALDDVAGVFPDVAGVFFMPERNISGIEPAAILKAVVIVGGKSRQDMVMGAEAVFGGMSICGRLSVDIAGLARKGCGVDVAKSRLGYCSPQDAGFKPGLERVIDSIVKVNIDRKSFPGCQVLVAKNGNIVLEKAYGTLDYAPGSPKVKLSTLYDVASMTKATASMAGLMAAYDKGLFKLDAKISDYIPALKDTDKKGITVRELLYHKSGLPSTINTYKLMADSNSYSGKLISYRRMEPYTVKLDKNVYGNRKARMRSDVTRRKGSRDFPIEIAKGIYGGDSLRKLVMETIYSQNLGKKTYRYSCLNFCLLMQMEENVTGVPHDQWVAREVFRPLGAWYAGFRPSTYYNMSDIAPTERDNFMRKQLLRGYVHDEIAAYSGGVQGNAGLFSNAGDLAKLCQTWLNGGVYGGERLFNTQTVKLFATSHDKQSNRGLGFDRATRTKSLSRIAGLPESTYGHTGFTGTCFWVDPENEIIFILLCNRVCPSRDNKAYNELLPRAALLNAVYENLK